MSSADNNSKMSFYKYFLLMLITEAVLSVIFAGFLSLSPNISFFTVFKYAFGFLFIISIPFTLWFYLVEPFWSKFWNDKLTSETRDKILSWGAILFMITFFSLAPSGLMGGDEWRGQGIVNLFPEKAVSKNYRLETEIQVIKKWWWRKDYIIDSVEWPDGELTHFSDCTISKANNVCTDNEDRSWRIEIVTPPTPPSRDD